MRAVLRLGLGIAAAALAVAPTPARAQDADPATSNTSGTVGPRELEDFSINGTVTTPAPPPTQPAPRPQPPAATRPPATATPAPTQPRPSAPAPDRTGAERTVARAAPAPAPVPAEPIRQTAPDSSVTVALPTMDGADRATADAAPVTLPAPASDGSPSLLPWALALLALAGGAAFFLWQRRERPAFAGGADLEEYVAAEPAPRPAARAPQPDPVPPKAPVDDAFAGFVSTRLRPWLELGFKPTRCSVEDDKVTIEFEIEVQNRGNAPARAVLIEARMVNAGTEQDGEIGAFFANPVGQGDRIPSIDPLKSIQIKSQIVTSRDQVQVYEVGGRSVFVPLLAFNILYEWARGQGQTSASYLVGRETKGDKMAPFRLDLGPRLFRTLDKRPLPLEVRH